MVNRRLTMSGPYWAHVCGIIGIVEKGYSYWDSDGIGILAGSGIVTDRSGP
jgi:hypothetical protein